MAEQMSMDSILEEPKAPEITPEPVAAEAPDAAALEAAEEARKEEYKSNRQKARDKESLAQGKVRDPNTGQFVAPPATTPEPVTAAPETTAVQVPTAAPRQEFTPKELALLKAAQEERAKRQAAERERDELRSKTTQEPAKAFWDNPEDFLKAQQAQSKAEIASGILRIAELHARQRHPDFDEKVAAFVEIAQQNPSIGPQMMSAPDPAEFAYTMGKNHLEIKQVGSMEEFRAKIERETAARVRSEMEAELKAKAEKLAQERAALPPSLSDARSLGGAAKPVWGGPPAMADILKD